jgi:hypothetical protein
MGIINTLTGIALGTWLFMNSPSYAQTFTANPAKDQKIYQEYEIHKVSFLKIDVAGKKKTIFQYTPLSDTIAGQEVVGVIEGSTDLNIKVGEEPSYDIMLRTYIDSAGYPLKTVTLRRNMRHKARVSDQRDLELIAEEGLAIPAGEYINELACETYHKIPGDTTNKKVINYSTGQETTVPKNTMDFMSIIYHVLTHPKDNVRRRYIARTKSNDPNKKVPATTEISIILRKEDDHYIAEAEIPSEIDIPLSGGSFKYHQNMAPFYIETSILNGILNPSAEAKR